MRHAALIESLPGYQADDPYKTELPPPAYENFHSSSGDVAGSSVRLTIDELVDSIETTDTTRLIDNQEDDFICLRQMAS